ncbi:glycosyl transferase group 1 [Melioribacter roseus P3M-2]|uniref:Glycosyl transferase group 1 n=1 Tax=Melioribacter roseus (strain DSM 23840 / JCM 17771 / VKM B-2668 / P3M-2) TaxID=1191523 RepID=I6Z947_MELRP|nr:glycosyltransferase [Melioribacter roseus]AFN75670.1 glycosyl transferase group 1 [Melioribacter roseus P3M-2]
MFKVLVLAYYYPPMGLSGVQRVQKFTKYLPHFNWEPTIITTGKVAYYAHDLSLLDEVKDLRIIRTESLDLNSIIGKKYGTVNVPKEFIRKIFSNFSKTFFIPDNKKSWAVRAYQKARELLQNEHFDVIFVSIPPYSSFVYAAKLKKEFNIPLIVDYRDLWLDNHFAYYPTPYHRSQHKKLEYGSLHAADRVVAVNRRIKEYLIQTYPFLTFEEVVIIPHGYDQEDFNVEVEEDLLSKEKLRFTYSGLFYESITPVYFLKAFKKLTVERPDIASNIELEFIGLLRDEYKKLIVDLGLNESVKIHGYIEHKDTVKRLKATNILWMTIGNTKNAETISTSKLFEYFGARKPILGCVPDGAAKTALIEYGASYITSPDNIDEIKNAFVQIYSDYSENKLPVPTEEFVAKHDRKLLTEQLTKLFQFSLREPI